MQCVFDPLYILNLSMFCDFNGNVNMVVSLCWFHHHLDMIWFILYSEYHIHFFLGFVPQDVRFHELILTLNPTLKDCVSLGGIGIMWCNRFKFKKFSRTVPNRNYADENKSNLSYKLAAW